MSDADATEYTCSSCGAAFVLHADDSRRCPRCLRASGLVVVDAPESSGSMDSRRRWLALLVLALILGAAAAFWYLTASSEEAPDLADTSTLTEEGADLEDVPKRLRLEPEKITGAVRLAAEEREQEPARLVGAVAEAWEAGRIRHRPADDEFAEAPRSASELAPALQGKEVGPAGSLELAILAESLLEAAGFEDVRWGMDDTGKGAATDLLNRRYLLRVSEGSWLAPDGGPVDPDGVTPLEGEQRLAHVLAWKALGAVHAGEDDLAARAAEQARALWPGDAALAFVAGQVQLSTGVPEMGLSAMEGAAKRRADARTWYVLGLAAMAVQQPAKARQYLLRAAEGDPTLADPHVLLAQLTLERLELTPKTGREALLDQVREHVAAAKAIDPDARGVRTIEAQLQALAGDLDAAEERLREETRLHPDDPQGWLVLAQFLRQAGREREALEALREAADRGVEGPGIYKALGAMLAQVGRLGEAGEALAHALEEDPADADLRPQLAQIRKAQGDVDDARHLLEQHLDLAPDDHRTRLLLAQLEADAGHTEEAAAQIDRVLEDDRDHPDAAVLRYVLALQRGEDAPEARARAIEAVEKRSNLAAVLLEQGLLEEGEALLREAMEEEPEDGMAPVLLAMVLVGRERTEEAEALRDRVLARVADEDARDALEQQFDAAFRQAREARREVLEEEGLAPELPVDELPNPPETP
ncbi:MAG: tetratricopeptide repeat protein [Myxococcota bacterium]